MKTTVIGLALVFFLSVAQATEWSTNLPCFNGGSYDGWDRQSMPTAVAVGGVDVTMSSGVDQQLAWLLGNPALSMLTITAASPSGTLTNGTTVQIGVPAAWSSWFDTSAAVTVGGSAVGKVGLASYSSDGRLLRLPVTADFANGDTLTVTGLKLAGIPPLPDTQRLELNFTGVLDAYDQYTLTASLPPSYNGGSYDGWDRNGPADYEDVGDTIAPSSATTFTAQEGALEGEIDLTWDSPGDDGGVGNLTGNYRIQYATYTVTWSTSGTPTDGTTVTISTTNAVPGSPQSYTVTGLAGGVTHYFVLWTGDEVPNWSDISNTASVLLAPSPPATGAMTARSETTLTAGWDFSLGTSSYTFVVSTAADNPPDAVAGSSNTVALSASVLSLTPNTTYYGFANACNGAGCSSYTAFGSTVTWANPPISLSTTTLDSTSATLVWAANNNPTGTTFEIEQAAGSGGPFSFTISTPGISTPIPGLSPGTTACFRVLARSWDGVPTAPTSEICVVPPFSTPGPSSFSESGTDTILASWTAAPGATSYTLSVSTASDNPPLVVIGSSSTVSLSASVASLTPNTTYFGFVKGCNGIDCGNDTALGSAVTLASVPMGLSSGTVTAVSMALSFDVNGNPSGTTFEIELALNGGSFASALTTTSDSATLSGLAPGANYTLRIRALNHNSVPTGYSSTLSFTTSGTLPATPVNFRGSAGPGGITYSWDPVTTNALGSPLPFGPTVSYELSESNSPTGSFSVLASTTGTSHGPLPAAGVERFYRVRTEVETLFSLPSTVIDNLGAGRYVYASAVGTAVASPQGLLTGVGHPRHVISLTDRPVTEGALVALDIAVIDGVTGTPATNVTFSPSGQLSVPLPGVSSGERSVEYFNGFSWVLAGTAHILSPNLAQFSFGRTGGYRLMGSTSGDVVRSVMARVFTPNGDGRNDVTVIRLNNPNGDPTHGTIYDTDGARVADMATGPAPGLSLAWDGRDANGASVPGGVYIYQITVGGRRATGTVVVSK